MPIKYKQPLPSNSLPKVQLYIVIKYRNIDRVNTRVKYTVICLLVSMFVIKMTKNKIF